MIASFLTRNDAARNSGRFKLIGSRTRHLAMANTPPPDLPSQRQRHPSARQHRLPKQSGTPPTRHNSSQANRTASVARRNQLPQSDVGVSLMRLKVSRRGCRQCDWRSSTSTRGSGWTSNAGPSCSAPSLTLSWAVARRTNAQALPRVWTQQHTPSRHQPARCQAPRATRHRLSSRIQLPAGRLAVTALHERP